MKEFHHITRKEYLCDILGSQDKPGEGLKPRSETGKEGWDNSIGNTQYIYLSKEPISVDKLYERLEQAGVKLPRDGLEREILTVKLPEDHPLERDYDQLLCFVSMKDEDLAKLGQGLDRKDIISRLFQSIGLEFKGDLSEQNLKNQFDRIPDEDYDRLSGMYRTVKPIPAANVSIYQPSATENYLNALFGNGNATEVGSLPSGGRLIRFTPTTQQTS